MGNSINNIKVTVGKEAVAAGTEAARSAVLPISGAPSIVKKAQNEKDPAIVGTNMATGKIMTSYDVGGSIPLSFRPCKGVGLALKSLLGTEATPAQVGGLIRIRYTGSEDSCKISASASGDTLDSDIGDKGSESGDSNFGTAGSIDLTHADFDTLDELVTVINGYTDYDCDKLFEETGGCDSDEILDITNLQAKDTYALVWFGSSASGVYKHTFTSDLTSSERTTLSIQKDGYQDNYLYTGCVVDSMSISGALKGFVESDVEVLGFDESDGEEASELSLEDIDPMAFSSGSSSIGDLDTTYISNFNLDIKNNSNADGYGQGSLGRVYHSKGTFEATGEIQIRLDSNSVDFRDLAFSSTNTSLFFEFEGRELASGVPEAAYIELPYCGIIEPDYPENNGVIDLKLGFEAFNPKGTNYNDPLTVTILTEDSAAY